MLAKVRETIRKYDMLQRRDKVVVAVSGGPDSTALLHLLRNLQKEYELELYVAHVNHMFRGLEADADASYVESLCETWNIPCFATRVNVPAIMAERGLSAQEAAREVRYHFLKHVAAITGSNKIAVGHNADDQAETILMRFIRGSGPEGLTGIAAVRCGIIRPLIEIFRGEIIDYCTAWEIKTREDSSNKKLVYLRNRMRHKLIPQLENEYNTQMRRSLLILGEILQGEEAYWAGIVEEELCRAVFWQMNTPYIQIDLFKKLPKALQRRIIRAVFQRIGITGAGFIHVEKVRMLLLQGSVGDALDLPGNWRAIRHYTAVTLGSQTPTRQGQIIDRHVLLEIPGEVKLPGGNMVAEITVQGENCSGTLAKRVALFDLERLHGPLYVRTRKPGDRFFHVGIGHRKKLKEYFIDQKVPQAQRDCVPLVTHGDEIIWIVGYYADKRYLANAATKTTLRIEFREG